MRPWCRRVREWGGGKEGSWPDMTWSGGEWRRCFGCIVAWVTGRVWTIDMLSPTEASISAIFYKLLPLQSMIRYENVLTMRLFFFWGGEGVILRLFGELSSHI